MGRCTVHSPAPLSRVLSRFSSFVSYSSPIISCPSEQSGHPTQFSDLGYALCCHVPQGPCTWCFLNLRFSFPLLSESFFFFFFFTFVKSFLYFLHRVNLSFPEALPSPSRVSVWLSSGQLKIISSTWVQKRL